MQIRPEQAGDEATIHALTAAAFKDMPFSDGTEPAIVDALRTAGALTLSLVAVEDGEIVGHVAFSPITVDGADVGWFALGPVSVWPAHQHKGIGNAVIREGLARLRAMGAQGCVLTGDPAYYTRFGFRTDATLFYAGADGPYFQILPFGDAVPAGEARFHPAFGEG